MTTPVSRLAALVRREAALLAALLLALLAATAALTPSHYGAAASILGLPHSGPVFGEAQPVRSDEWAVTTPYFQIAVANDLGPIDRISPYHEPLKGFFALPSRDWSMALKPDLWGFLVLPPAHAFALHYASLAFLMLAGFAILLRQLGLSRNYAFGLSALIFASQFVQVWWSSNPSTFAWLPWPAVILMSRAPWPLRMAATAFACAAWLVGQLYPPFQITGAFALAALIAAFRPEALRLSRLAPVLAGAAAGVGAAWLHYADLIPIMADTVYPGRRLSDGGGVPPLQLAAHLFPSLVTARFEPLPLWPTNACEAAVLGSFLPLAVMTFCDHRALADWVRANGCGVLIWIAALAFAAAWMLLPIPGRLVPPLAFVPPGRMLWAFGLLLTVGFGLAGGAAPWRLTWRRTAIFALLVVAGWFVSKRLMSSTPLAFGRFDLVAAPLMLAAALAHAVRPSWAPCRRIAGTALLATALVTFGRFNPVQPAGPIFTKQSSPTVEAYRRYAAASPYGWVVIPGMYGSILNGAGVPAVNHTLLRPQLGFFREAFPRLEPKTFNQVFNRYGHIVPANAAEPATPQADVVIVPAERFAAPLRVRPGAAAGGPPQAGSIDAFTALPAGPGRWEVRVTGWRRWSGMTSSQSLEAALAGGRILAMTAWRLPRPDVAANLGDPTLFAAGFGLRLQVEADRAPIQADLRLRTLDAAAPVQAPALARR